jgi:hypothetical protein
MWQTCALLIALATAGTPEAQVRPLSGETPQGFLCRATAIPEGRACARRCEQDLQGPARAEEAWACVLACSHRTQHAIADCRVAPSTEPSTPLATR